MLATLVLLAASSFAGTAKSYDGLFSVDLPSGLTIVQPAAFSKAGPARPYLALEKRGEPLPVLLIIPVDGVDAKETGARERKAFIEHNKGNMAFKPSTLRSATLKNGAVAYWFSNGRTAREFTFIFVPFQGRVLKAACPAEDRLVCAGILGTIKPHKKAETPGAKA